METLYLDNSKRSEFISCPTKYNLSTNHGLRSNYGSTALRFGSTWHAIQEGYHRWVVDNAHWPRNESEELAAITKALQYGKLKWDTETESQTFHEDFRNFNTAVEAFELYLQEFEDDKNFMTILQTEQIFECPITPDDDIQYQLMKDLPSIVFTGKIDLCVKMDNRVWLLDFKTTAWRLDQVIMEFNRAPQFVGYSYAGRKFFKEDIAGCLVSVLHLNSRKSPKTGEYGKISFNFRRPPQIYTEGDLNAWKLAFISTCRDIHRAKQEGFYPQHFDSCYQYGGCRYLSICKQHKPVEELNLQEFHVDFWDVRNEV